MHINLDKMKSRPMCKNPSSILIFFLISILGCSGPKVLFKGMPQNIDLKIPEATIVLGDIIDIRISSLNSESAAIFSTNMRLRTDNSGLIARKLDGYLIDSSGDIEIPIIGKIKAAGLTCSSLTDIVKKRLIEYVLKPHVKIKILNFRVSILGEVNRPGTFDVVDQNISLPELISKAGDFKKNADPTKVMLIRDIDGKIETNYLDLTSSNFLNSEYYFLKQNDKIYVQPDNASLAFDFGFFRNLADLALITSIILLLTK